MAKNENAGLGMEELQRKALEMDIEERGLALEERRTKKARQIRNHDSNEKTLADGRARDTRVQQACNHRKGGNSHEEFVAGQGDDGSDYAVRDHMYAHDPRGPHRECLRCGAQWKPGDTAADHPTGIGYKEARSWPTKNKPSGAVSYTFPPGRELVDAR